MAAVMAALAARRMRVFNFFSYLQRPVGCRITVSGPPRTGLAPGGAGGRDLGETASVSGQLSVLLARPVVRAAVPAVFTG